MSHSNEDPRFSDDLQHVADVLRDGRPTLDPLALDRVKLRAMNAAQRSTSTNKGSHMKQRLTTLIAAGLLTLGTGGTLALAGGGDGAGGGSASFHQYKPPCDHGKGQGGDHECHGHEGEGGQGGGDKGGGQGGGDKGGQGGGGQGGKGGGQGGGDKGGQVGGKGTDKGGSQSGGGDKGGHGHH